MARLSFIDFPNVSEHQASDGITLFCCSFHQFTISHDNSDDSR